MPNKAHCPGKDLESLGIAKRKRKMILPKPACSVWGTCTSFSYVIMMYYEF